MTAPDAPRPARHALVIGAGVAGAASCVALARLGWRVSLIDGAADLAGGASGLPVGMLSPYITRAPTPLSRLCAIGWPDALLQLQRMTPGHGWQSTEVDNLHHAPGRWPAALVRMSALVRQWLDEAQQRQALETHWGRRVARLERTDTGEWLARDPQGLEIARAPCVVLSSAFGTRAVLENLPGFDTATLPIRPVKGQLSFAALEEPALAPRPMRNNGVFVPCYEDAGLPPQWPSKVWAMGSTYERGADNTRVEEASHERNASSLQNILPQAAERMRATQAQGRLMGWSQVRCASQDRVPMVGAAPDVPALTAMMSAAGSRRGRIGLDEVPRLPGLYLMAAFGSRGLTLAHWCATLLASRMDGGPGLLAPEEADLERAMDPARFAWKLARRQPAAGSGGQRVQPVAELVALDRS